MAFWGILEKLVALLDGRDTFALGTPPLKGVGRPGGSGTPEQLAALGVKWSYVWAIHPKWAVPGFEYVPMIHLNHTPEVVVRVAGALPKGTSWLVYNEPESRHSPDYDPQRVQAVEHYKAVSDALYAFDPTARLIVGNVYILGGGSYWPGWLRSFRGDYFKRWGRWPKADGWGFHNWPPGTYNSADWRKRALGVWSWQKVDKAGGELWLSEYGWFQDQAVAVKVMKEQTPWVAKQGWLARYAWYGTSVMAGEGGALCKSTGGLTKLGEMYAAV